MHLEPQHALKRTSLWIKVDEIRSFVAIDPMLVMIPLHHNAVVEPLIGREGLHRHRSNHPGLAVGIYDHFLTGMRQNPTTALFVKHAILVVRLGHNIALVA